MTAVSAGVPDGPVSQLWAERAAARRTLFTARDAMTASVLQRAGNAAGRGAGPGAMGSIGAPPFKFALEKPVMPRDWKERRAFRKIQRKRRRELLEAGLFDDAWYRAQNADVAQAGEDGLTHFLMHGSFEGRSPGPHFDAIGYLARYPDVVAEQIEPWLHYVRHGRPEGRSPG